MNIPQIFIFNKQEILQCVLTTVTPNGCPFFDDELEVSIDFGASYYQFSCPGDHHLTSRIEEEGYAAIKDQDGEFLLFRIRRKEEEIDNNGAVIVHVYCESDALDLLGTPVRPMKMEGYTLTQALNQILTGTGWETGYIEFLGARTFTIEKHMTALKAIHELRSVYSCEIRFRVEIKGSKITRRYIEIASTFGTYTGHRFELGKDIARFIRKSSTEEIATAVLGVGTDDQGNLIDFANVVWSKANGNPVDKPAGQDWVGDEEARELWGKRGRHVFYIHESESNTPESILSNSYGVLQNRNKPKIEIQIDGMLLERVSGYENDKKRLGDTVVARVTALNPVFTATIRITKLILSQTDPSKDQVTLSNYQEINSNPITTDTAENLEVKSPTAFFNLILQNGAVAINGREPKYSLKNDEVEVTGEIQNIAVGTVIATLPSGYRPASARSFVTAAITGSGGNFMTFQVSTNGQIVLLNSTSGLANISLSGIRFRIGG
jgi:phage minor structural protein